MGYFNPLARAEVSSERIDQGVDYAGSGALIAIGAARITFLATANTGWPGAFIDYQLLGGPDNGCYVYYAEGSHRRLACTSGRPSAPARRSRVCDRDRRP